MLDSYALVESLILEYVLSGLMKNEFHNRYFDRRKTFISSASSPRPYQPFQIR